MLGDFFEEFQVKFESEFDNCLEQLPIRADGIDEDVRKTFFEPIKEFTKGGKRLRPYLICIGADSTIEKAIKAGVAFELLHTFVLIHDDIMDGAKLRRGKATVHVDFQKYTKHGNWAAMLLGDYICSFANEYVGKNVPELSGKFYGMQKFLYVGQFFEMMNWGRDVSDEVSARIEFFKSAQYTFMYPLEIGLAIAGKDKINLDGYAENAGLAFQMRDDWLDVSDLESGKDKGLDVKNEVANSVQRIVKDAGGDIEKSRLEVEDRLEKYRMRAIASLENAEVTNRQKDNLLKLLNLVSRI